MSRNIARFFHFSSEIEFNALRFINYTIPRLRSTYAVATIVTKMYHQLLYLTVWTFSGLMIWLQCRLLLLYMNVFVTFLLPISAIISFGLKMFIVSAPDNPDELICLLFVAMQLNMDFNLSITQVFGFGILFQLTYEIWFLSSFSVLKLDFTFYQIITQFDTYLHMYIIYKILINVLTCEILQTYVSSILYWMYFLCYKLRPLHENWYLDITFRGYYKQKLCLTKACISQNLCCFFGEGGGRASPLVLYYPRGSSRYQSFFSHILSFGSNLKTANKNVPLKLYLLIYCKLLWPVIYCEITLNLNLTIWIVIPSYTWNPTFKDPF